MKRKFVYIAVFVALTITWIYWSSNVEFNNTVLLLKKANNYFKDKLIVPINTTCASNPFLLIIVTSYVGHVELRSAHRRAMPQELLESMNARRVFLLAKIPQHEKYITQQSIKDESNTFGDILQGAFLENYRNLTYKHLMGLHWASTECNTASFLLKVDDDTVFNMKRTHDLLLKLNSSENFIMGYMLNNTRPRRNKENKWYVTQDEYQRNYYPPYLSGWYYITTPQVAGKLHEESHYHSKFWIDDILVTGILTEALNIKLRQVPNNYWLEYYELLECCLKDMMQKFLVCEYVVGPNGGRNNLIFEFNQATRNCDEWGNCTARSAKQNLNNNCVAYRERHIFSDGRGEIQYLKV